MENNLKNFPNSEQMLVLFSAKFNFDACYTFMHHYLDDTGEQHYVSYHKMEQFFFEDLESYNEGKPIPTISDLLAFIPWCITFEGKSYFFSLKKCSDCWCAQYLDEYGRTFSQVFKPTIVDCLVEIISVLSHNSIV